MTLNGSHFLILLKKNKTKQNKNPSKVKVIKHQEEWTYIFPRNDDNVFFFKAVQQKQTISFQSAALAETTPRDYGHGYICVQKALEVVIRNMHILLEGRSVSALSINAPATAKGKHRGKRPCY